MKGETYNGCNSCPLRFFKDEDCAKLDVERDFLDNKLVEDRWKGQEKELKDEGAQEVNKRAMAKARTGQDKTRQDILHQIDETDKKSDPFAALQWFSVSCLVPKT